VLPGGLVGELREAADQLLVDVAHLQVGDGVGVEIDVAEFRDHLVEEASLVEPRNLGPEVELIDNIAGGHGEAADVGEEVGGHILRVIEQATEGQRRGVVELLAGDSTEDRVHVLDPPRQLCRLGEDSLLGRLEDAVEASDDRERQDDLAVLGLLVVAAEEVGHAPDKGGVVADGLALGCRGWRYCRCHLGG
jgi:hypothetical protein